jgi:diguanylate cyclase (GGDEF)-like protein
MNVAEPLRVLMVEDDANDAELELYALRRAGLRVDSRVVSVEHDFRNQVPAFRPHVILSDFSMPSWDGMSALDTAREVCPEVPFIFVSGTLGEEYAIRALKNGAVDYVLKTNLVRLPAAVERAVQDARDRAARRSAESELDEARIRLHSIFSTVDDVLWSVTLPSMRLAYVSPSAELLFGRPIEALMAEPRMMAQLVYAQDALRVEEAWGGLRENGHLDIEYRIVRPSGELRWVHARARLGRQAAPGGSGAMDERVDGILRDITDRMEERQRIARLSRMRAVLSSINSALLRLRNRDALLDEACRIAVDAGGFTMACIATVNAAERQLVLSAVRGEPASLSFPMGLVCGESEKEGPARQAIRTAEPVVDNEWRAAPTGPAVQSKACLPILVDGQPIGVLILRSPEPDFFDLEEVRLLRTLTGNLGFALELIHKQEQLNYLAYYDALTGLPNRTLFQDRLNQALGRARRGGGMAALIIFDVERFKAINDSLGQPAGDRLLQLIADRLRGAVGDTHHLARLAGNQFSVLLPTVVDEASVVRELGEQAGGMFEAPFDIQGNELRIAAKAGIAVFPGDGADADTLFRNAEAALKRAKASGDPYLFYAPQINALVAGRLDLENRLRKAVQLQQFVLHYQPKVDLLTRRFTGLEALIRWNDPDNGLVPPGHFIALLEETGLIQRVGKWAMEEAIRAYRGWSEKGLRPPRVAVNLSPVQLRQRGLVEDVRALAAGNGEACGLDLEITESLLMENVEQSTEMLRAIRDIGVRIGIDDFGTGYSSLSYIHKLPVDLLKIDRSFIAGMTDDAGKTGIVSTIISLAQSLRLKVVAEGVETEDQAQLLRLLRCDQIQGFLISRPIPEQEIESLLREQAASA